MAIEIGLTFSIPLTPLAEKDHSAYSSPSPSPESEPPSPAAGEVATPPESSSGEGLYPSFYPRVRTVGMNRIEGIPFAMVVPIHSIQSNAENAPSLVTVPLLAKDSGDIY